MILSGVKQRRAELRAMDRALETEAESLRCARDGVDTITGWLGETNESRLSDQGFDSLQAYHETFDQHRTRCDRLVQERQEVLHGTTSQGAVAGLRHWSLVGYLYQELSTTFPVLSTAVRLEDHCTACQRTVRDQLTRRN